MKRILLIAYVASFLLVACNNESKTEAASSDTSGKMEEKKADKVVMPDSATATKNWQEYMTPGKEHEMLAKSNGVWTGTVTMWEYDGAQPKTSTATSNNKMIMDGRYQLSTVTGNMMGMPFEGMSTVGFDNHKKVFESAWIDNLGTGVMKMEGPWDEATKSMTLKGTMMNPATKQPCDFRETFTIVDDNNQIMEMYGPDPKTGKEFKTMEIKFTRKK